MAKTLGTGKRTLTAHEAALLSAIEAKVRDMIDWEDRRLYLLVAKRIRKVARRAQVARKRGISVARARLGRRPGPLTMNATDRKFIEELIEALQRVPSVAMGEFWFNRLWKLMTHMICKRWRFCEKMRDYEDAIQILTALISYLVRHLKILDDTELMTALIMLGWHKGPDWMCKCTKAKYA